MGITKKTFRNRTKRGGLSDTSAAAAGGICTKDCTDLVGFYNYYLKKHDEQLITSGTGYKRVVVPMAAPFSLDTSDKVNNILLVIDLQNDFVDIPMEGLDGPGPPPGETKRPGSFSVMASSKIITPLRNFIDKGLGDNSLKKVIFSRDWHDASHCSFQRQQGPFPTHCLTNGIGAAFTPGLIENAGWLTDPKVLVVYKGIDETVDSFGAFKYKTDYVYPTTNFISTRQSGPKCCGNFGAECDAERGGSETTCMACSRLTGGFKRREQSKQVKALDFEKIPFITNNGLCSKNCDLVPFIIDDLGLDSKKKNNIYICGLAGDYCVRDTAINIANELVDLGLTGPMYNIHILQEFTRYAYLPLCGLGGGPPSPAVVARDSAKSTQADQRRELKKQDDEIRVGNTPFYFTHQNELVPQFGKDDPNKPINFYLFKTNFDPPKTKANPDGVEYSIIPKEDLKDAIGHFYYKPLPQGSGTKGYCSSPGNLWHFISSDIDILKQYNDLNIKIIMPPPLARAATRPSQSSAQYVPQLPGEKRAGKQPAQAPVPGAGSSAQQGRISSLARGGMGGRKSCNCGHKSCNCGRKSRRGGRKSCKCGHKSRKLKGRLVGVTPLKNGRFRATFARRTLGVFDTAKQAAAAYVKAVKEDRDCCD